MDKAERKSLTLAAMPMVQGVVRSFRPEACDYDDLVQAGMVAVLRALDAFDSKSGWDPLGWAKMYVVRDVQRELDKLRNDHGMLSLEDVLENETLSLELPKTDDDTMEQLQVREQLIDSIIALDSTPARRLMLMVLEGRTVSEAGRVLNLSQSAADRLYQRTVDELREQLVSG